ncbi:MAG: ACT domain-containing protein [Acidimicrobiales bacterium]
MATDLRIEADNTVGQLATLGEELGKVGVNIDGFCATVGDGRGVLHVLVEDAGAARQALEGAGYTIAAEREALVLEGVEDRPGYLGEMARRLADSDVNIEVAYLATNTRVALVVPDVATARQAL